MSVEERENINDFRRMEKRKKNASDLERKEIERKKN